MEITQALPIAGRKIFPRYFEDYLEYLAVFEKKWIYSTTSCGTPKNILRNPGWETVSQSGGSSFEPA
jgi:hypothetical protein